MKPTARQREVWRLLANGSTDKEIGSVLGLARGTVKHHVGQVYQRTGARNRVEAALMFHKIEVMR